MKTVKIYRRKLAFCLLASLLPLYQPSAWAEELTEFDLDPVVVTASRQGKRDFDMPAKVNVYTAAELEATGASNVIEALKYAEGVVYHSQGPAGQSMDMMTSKLVVRGQDRGTLVLLDGVPLNLGGGFSLENMSLSGIERIEVVKGAGSVLYGGDTTGGVINIISKKAMDKKVFAAAGNYERYDAGASWQEGKLGFSYQNSHLGEVQHFGESFVGPGGGVYYNFADSCKDLYRWDYRFDEHLSISQLYGRNRYARSTQAKSTGLITARNDYDAYQNVIVARYANRGFTANLYNNYRSIYNQTVNQANLQNTTKDRLSGLGLQYDFALKTGGFTAGLDVQQEYTGSRVLKSMPLLEYDRMNYAVFAEWERPLGNKWTVTLGARETWTEGDEDYDGLSAQAQFAYQAGKDVNIYASLARTFVLPTLSQAYGVGSTLGNPGLRPQNGNQWEVGAKYNRGVHSWRLSVFSLNIEDYIAANHVPGSPGDLYYTNEDRKNTGVELSYAVGLKNGVSLKLGAVYGNPRYRSAGSDAWRDQYGRYQFNLGLDYEKAKWSGGLYGNYLGGRTIADDNATTHPAPLFLTGMRIAYKPGAGHEFYCNLDNLFGRRGITSNTATTSAFYQMGFNFQIGYRYKFK